MFWPQRFHVILVEPDRNCIVCNACLFSAAFADLLLRFSICSCASSQFKKNTLAPTISPRDCVALCTPCCQKEFGQTNRQCCPHSHTEFFNRQQLLTLYFLCQCLYFIVLVFCRNNHFNLTDSSGRLYHKFSYLYVNICVCVTRYHRYPQKQNVWTPMWYFPGDIWRH